jgi:hypothetical protein
MNLRLLPEAPKRTPFDQIPDHRLAQREHSSPCLNRSPSERVATPWLYPSLKAAIQPDPLQLQPTGDVAPCNDVTTEYKCHHEGRPVCSFAKAWVVRHLYSAQPPQSSANRIGKHGHQWSANVVLLRGQSVWLDYDHCRQPQNPANLHHCILMLYTGIWYISCIPGSSHTSR